MTDRQHLKSEGEIEKFDDKIFQMVWYYRLVLEQELIATLLAS